MVKMQRNRLLKVSVTESLRDFRPVLRSRLSVLYIILSINQTVAWSSIPRVTIETRISYPKTRIHSSTIYASKPKQSTDFEIVPSTLSSVQDMADIQVTSAHENRLDSLSRNIFLGVQPTPEIIAIMAIYFVEGSLGLARLAQTFYLKDTLHLGPAESSALAGVFGLPWMIKPLYGLLSDSFPLFGSRRRNYLILCGLLGAASYAAVGCDFWQFLDNGAITLAQGSIGALVVSSACIAFSDVVADGIVVERTRDSSDPSLAGALQSLCWGSAAFGGIITAYFSGSLLEVMGPKQVFLLTSVLPMIVALIAFFVDDAKLKHHEENGNSISENVNLSQQLQTLWSAVKEPSVWKPTLFLFLWQSTPTSEGAFFYFMNNELGLGPEFFGRVRFIVSVASLVGVWLYQKALRSVPIKDILFWSTVVSAPLGLVQLLLVTHTNRLIGIPDTWFIFGDDVVLTVLGQIAFLPTLALAAKLCPPGVEAVLFAFLMSLFNGASTIGTEIGAALTKILGITESNFDNLGILTIVCNISSLYPLLFIGLLNGIGAKSDADLEAESNQKESSMIKSE